MDSERYERMMREYRDGFPPWKYELGMLPTRDECSWIDSPPELDVCEKGMLQY